MTAPLHVRVNNRWRTVTGMIHHPSGDRYQLAPVANEPDTVLIRLIEISQWRTVRRKPAPKLVS